MPLVYEALSYQIRAALFEVYNTLGPGFREETYKLKVILELKAAEELHPRHTVQLLSFLKASDLRLGLLVNFGKDRIQIIRQDNSEKR